MKEAVLSGVPASFSFFITLYHARNLWFDKKIAGLKLTHSIKYNNLKKEFIVMRSWENDKARVTKSFNEAQALMADIDSLKIHLMHVLKDTPLERELEEGRFKPLEFDEYIPLVCDFLEYIPPHISIQRLTADGPRAILLAPKWATQKHKTLAAIEAELERRGSCQGSRLR